MGRMRAAALAIAAMLCACCLALAACEERSEPGDAVILDETSLLTTPAYYVFESVTIDDYTITDPNQLVMDGDGGHFENWYYLSIAIHGGTSGKLCTDGRIADFTYERVDDAIILNVPLDFGYDGAKLELGEGTLTMIDDTSTTVLRLVDEAPMAALAAD